MRYLIVSDMHSNSDAFEAVLERIDGTAFDVSLVLGDLVGYGAGPNEVVAAVAARLPGRVVTVRGNHDKVVAGLEDGANFNHAALEAAKWTADCLSAENLRRVQELPQGPREVAEGVSICHGSPLDEDAYVFSDLDAEEIFEAHSPQVTFFGHTHVPSLFLRHEGGVDVALLRGDGEIAIVPGVRYLINPGSIGQPRDRDPRAAYMTFDSEEGVVRGFRVTYPVEKAQQRILDAGLPRVLAERLAVGI